LTYRREDERPAHIKPQPEAGNPFLPNKPEARIGVPVALKQAAVNRKKRFGTSPHRNAQTEQQTQGERQDIQNNLSEAQDTTPAPKANGTHYAVYA
jgi:hypothetical protein